MAHEDNYWRERLKRDEENRRLERGGSRRGDDRSRQSYATDWNEGPAGREFNRDWPAESSQNWGDRREADWEQTSWRDLERDRGYGRGGERPYGGREATQGAWSAGSHDPRQDRDYAGSMRSSDRGGRSRGTDMRDQDRQSYPGRSSASDYGSSAYRGMERGYGYGGPHDWGNSGARDERGFWDKATDEVSSWFGDEDAERRREMDRRHSGLGPRNYARSDARINEDVCDRLTDHPMIDASDIEVSVADREVTLTGTVNSRDEKRRAEDIVEAVSGVAHVQNNLRVKQAGTGVRGTLDSLANATSGAFGERGGSTMSSRSGASGPGSSSSPGSSASSDATRTTTGSSPGVMRADPSTAPTKGA